MRRRLLFWLLMGVLVSGLAAAAVVFYQARRQANEFFDYQLRQLAFTLRAYSPSQLGQTLQFPEGLDFVIQVWSPDGRTLYASHAQARLPAPSSPGFADIDTEVGTWRVFALWHEGLTIQVGQHRLAREALALGAAARTLAPFVLVLPLMGFLIWRLVGREVRVLENTARAVSERSPESLEPIAMAEAPEEIRPLIDSLNGLLGRLGGALAQQRRFIADAAHELRTPLTALRLQLQLAQRAREPAEREQALATLGDGIARATLVVEQLLALAREDPAAAELARQPVDLLATARSVVEEMGPLAGAKNVALVLEAQVDDAVVEGDPAALRTVIANLVDNAVRYTPTGTITARVLRGGTQVHVEVEDTGPGIPEAERERVFDRFYRGDRAAAGGSGLGLAIARRIAHRHGGDITLHAAPGGGLLARLSIPSSP